ncbi:MAG: hypothetical protein U1E21_05915 [Reyranellaceae bacterium]
MDGNNVSGLLLVLREDARRRGFHARTIAGHDASTTIHSVSEFVLGLRRLAERQRTVCLVNLCCADDYRVAAMCGSDRHAGDLPGKRDVLDYTVVDYAPIHSDQRDGGRNHDGAARFFTDNEGNVVSLAWLKLPHPPSRENVPEDLATLAKLQEEAEALRRLPDGDPI